MSNSSIIVVKIGGSTLGRHDTTLEDLVALQREGWRPLVVHGGGAAISEWLNERNAPTRFERGLRVTDAQSLRVVVAVLAGIINKELVAAIDALGGRAMGLSGADGGLLRVRQLDPGLGYVGRIERVDSDLCTGLLEQGYLPVVAPLGLLAEGEPALESRILNINADTVAGALAAALEARKVIFLTDVEGVLADAGDPTSLISECQLADVERMIADSSAGSGMIPKLGAVAHALRGGVAAAHVVDGRVAHSVLIELFTELGIGTKVVP